MERRILFLVDPSTGERIYTRQEQMRRKIIKAVIKGDTIYDGAPPFPAFLDRGNKKNFLDYAASLIAEFMTDRQTYDDLMGELKEAVERDKAKEKKEFEEAELLLKQKLSEKLIQKKLEKVGKCLNVKCNRLPEPLNSLCNPNTKGWRNDENILISKLLVVYREFTPLKTSRRIYENMAMIFIACGLRSKMTESNQLAETLRKRRIKAAVTF